MSGGWYYDCPTAAAQQLPAVYGPGAAGPMARGCAYAWDDAEPYGNVHARYRMRDVRYEDFFGRHFVPNNTRPFVACDAEISSELRPIQVREAGGVFRPEAREWRGPLVQGTVHWQQPDFRPWHFTEDTRQGQFCHPGRMYRDAA